MAISLIAAFIGSVVAAVGTGVLSVRCLRSPRADLICLTVALAGLTVALGALTLGNFAGFGPASFRVMELGGQVLAPLALCLALAEMAGTMMVTRFAARLILSALAVIAFVVLSTDQLNPGVAFSKAWPAAAAHYETIPDYLLKFILVPVIVVFALIAIVVTAVRSGRDPAWRPAIGPVGATAGAALLLAIPAAVTLPVSSMFAVLGLAAAALTWFAGHRLDSLRADLPDDRRADESAHGWPDQDTWDGQVDQTGDFDALAIGDEGAYRDNGLYRPDAGGYEADGPGGQYAGRYPVDETDAGLVANGHGRRPPDPLPAEYGDHSDHSEASPADRDADSAAQESQAALFGQIAIYTLLEDRVGEFDLLTEKVVEQVRAREPDTLVYIVHAVPSAPMQRILYEVYRDRGAYDEHRLRPYVARFEIDRRPYVLATNVIELGLQQGKISSLPALSDLLGSSRAVAPDPVQPGPARHPGPGQTGHSHPGPGQAAPGHPGPAQHGNGHPGPSEHGNGHGGQAQPGYDKLGLRETRPDKPRQDKPRYDEGYDELGLSNAGSGEPRYRDPRYDRPPSYDRPRSDGPRSDGPRSDGPRSDRPRYTEPEYGQPGYNEPRYDESRYGPPGRDDPRYREPGYGEARYSEPGSSHLGYDRPQRARPDGPADREEGPQRQW